MLDSLKTKILSSLDNCFLDEDIDKKREIKSITAPQGVKVAFQLGFYLDCVVKKPLRAKISLEGTAAKFATVREVICVPNHYPVNAENSDKKYLRTEAGLYPDLIRPLHYGGAVSIPSYQLRTLWIEIEFPSGTEANDYSLSVSLVDWQTGEEMSKNTLSVRLLDINLPKQKLIHTEWIYTDCIAQAHHVPVFSEEHWKLIENYIRVAVRSGINMIFTPVFTPELDTYIGGERLTTQLIDITVIAENVYEFNSEKLLRWIDLCLSLGVEYFEIPHFFTQWGAEHAPKFEAYVNGERKRIFGWETDANSYEYRTFISQLIPAILSAFKKKGVDKQCFFHVSDEPRIEHLEQYKRCKNMIAPYLEGYNIIDALSDYDFYKLGILKTPVPAIKHIKPFLEANIEGLWAYYCGASGAVDVTNRFMSMPLSRVRILGVQLYLAKIKGFLHWGYNYYNNQYSYEAIDPFLHTDNECFAPAGDAFLVYPGEDGTPWESLRLCAMREAMEDIRALELCESIHGREFTESLVHRMAGGELDFFNYPICPEFFERLREELFSVIAMQY